MLEWKMDAMRQLWRRMPVDDGATNQIGPGLTVVVQQAARFEIEIIVDEVVAAELEQDEIRFDLRKHVFQHHQLLQGAVAVSAMAENLHACPHSDDCRIRIS